MTDAGDDTGLCEAVASGAALGTPGSWCGSMRSGRGRCIIMRPTMPRRTMRPTSHRGTPTTRRSSKLRVRFMGEGVGLGSGGAGAGAGVASAECFVASSFFSGATMVISGGAGAMPESGSSGISPLSFVGPAGGGEWDPILA